MSGYPLPIGDLRSLGFQPRPLEHLDALIRNHIEEGRYPGAQIALARNGQLALFRTYGNAKTEGGTVAAGDDTLFLLFSQTKVLTSAALWTLVEEGKVSFMDRVADHLPEFAVRGKGEITLQEVMTHRGGFPSSNVTPETWADHALMRAQVCDFSLEWTPGTRLQYHGQAAHLVQAMVIEAVTGQDYRDVIRTRITEPLGLDKDIFVGVPAAQQGRCADTYGRDGRENTADFRAAGLPSGGGYATARGMAAFYQMLGHGGRLGDKRLFSPRLLAYVSRNHTAEMPDHAMTMIPMHRGLGPHVRGESDRIRGLGTIGAPGTFGHGGVGSSYSWTDPSSGVSFTYLTNFVSPDPWHSMRLDRVSNLVHAAID
ncbi:MAG: serine hydrolase domain-containing protein [Acetobacteraceae bacterium]